jgi:hypothetical protein
MQADKSRCNTAGNLGAMVMQRRQLSLSFRCGLMLLVLTPLADAASAQSKFSPSEAKFSPSEAKISPSEEYPGPWHEVTQEVRDFLAVHKVYACDQAAGRQSSLNSGEYLLYCTRDEKHWTSWRVQTATHKLRGPDNLIEGIPLPDAYYR